MQLWRGTKVQAFIGSIIPLLLHTYLLIYLYRFEINVKNASILGLVGTGGIGVSLLFVMSAYIWSEVGSILIGLIVLVLVIEQVSSRIRIKLARG
ncbi:MAG: PhnE/PtxC family ABC transporter permease [Clostridia bacterium]